MSRTWWKVHVLVWGRSGAECGAEQPVSQAAHAAHAAHATAATAAISTRAALGRAGQSWAALGSAGQSWQSRSAPAPAAPGPAPQPLISSSLCCSGHRAGRRSTPGCPAQHTMCTADHAVKTGGQGASEHVWLGLSRYWSRTGRCRTVPPSGQVWTHGRMVGCLRRVSGSTWCPLTCPPAAPAGLQLTTITTDYLAAREKRYGGQGAQGGPGFPESIP